MSQVGLLEDVMVVEISEVENPAIRETFYIMKGDKMVDIFSDAYYEKLEKKVGKKTAEAIKSALQILMPVFKNSPDDVKSAIVTLAEAVGYGYPEPDKYPAPEQVELEKRWESKINTVEKVINRIAEQVDRLIEEFEKLKADLSEVNLKKSDNPEDNSQPQVDVGQLSKALDELISLVENKIKEEEAIYSGLKKLLRGEN